MRIRLASFNDIDDIVKYDKEVNLTYWPKKNYKEVLDNPHQDLYVIEANKGNVVGAVAVSCIFDDAEVLQLWVKCDSQKKGYARALLDYVFNQVFTKKSIKRVFLEVRYNNFKAINLYKSFGFIQVGVRENYYIVDSWRIDALTMMLEF